MELRRILRRPNGFKYGLSKPYMKPNGAQIDLKGAQIDSKWSPNGQTNRYEDPSKVNCSIHLIAHGLRVHFDMVFERKNGPKLVLIPDQCALSIVATKNRDVLRRTTFCSRKTVSSAARQRPSWYTSPPCQPKKHFSLASYKTEVIGTRFRHTFSSAMFFSKPNPARNPPGAEGLAHHRAIQTRNGSDDLPLKRTMGTS